MDKIRVALVDDHKLFRDGLKMLVQSNNDIEVVGEYGCASDLIKHIHEIDTQILITDISMNGMNGLELTQYFNENYESIKVIILSMHINKEFIIKAMEAGAKAYLPKDIAGKELIEAIYEVNQGREYFNKNISSIIMRSLMRNKSGINKQEELTNREIEVLRLAANGLMNKEVADKLQISVRTVDCHKNNIMNKLKLNTTAELVKYAIKNRIIEI